MQKKTELKGTNNKTIVYLMWSNDSVNDEYSTKEDIFNNSNSYM